MIKDCPLRTTEQAMTEMKDNFADYGKEDRLPAVRKGTAMTGDNS